MTHPKDDLPTRVLVVDDEATNRELLEAILQGAGCEIIQAGGGEEALTLAREKKPDLIILDLMMPGISGFEVCAQLKMDPQTGGIPILFVTALDEVGNKERALAAGGDDFLTKPIQRASLLARVEALVKVRHLNRDLDQALAYLHDLQLGRHAEQPRKPVRPAASAAEGGAILVVDDDPIVRKMFIHILQGAGYSTHEAESGPQALEIAQQKPVDIVLLDIMMPKMSGLEVLAKLGEFIPSSPVVIVTASPTSENAITALRLGAFDFIVKGFKNEVMLATVARAMERRRMVIRDKALISQLEAKIQELLAILAGHARELERMIGPR